MISIIALFVALFCVAALVAVIVSGLWSRGSAPSRPAYFTFSSRGPRLAALVAPSARDTQNINLAELASEVEDCEGTPTLEFPPPQLGRSVLKLEPILCTEEELNQIWSTPPVWADIGVWCE